MSGVAAVTKVEGEEGRAPNFLLLVGDDVGYNDVSWNNPAMSTPHLEALRRDGVSLETFYSQPRCSPSRAALLTGLYPYRLGIQRGNISPFRPAGLASTARLLPQRLAELGYSSHLVGLWHLGYCAQETSPYSCPAQHKQQSNQAPLFLSTILFTTKPGVDLSTSHSSPHIQFRDT